jgi:serine/threonine-protein kinase
MAFRGTPWRSFLTFAPFLPLGALVLAACSSSSGGASPADGGTSSGEDAAGGGPDGSSDGSTATGGDSGGTGTDGSTGTGGDSGGKPEGGGGTTGNTTSAASWFPSSMYFNQPVDTAPLDANSATVISTLVTNGGWGGGSGLQIDTSIDVYYADASSKRVPFATAANLAMPDSDIPTTVPIAPTTAASSAAPGFESDTACSDDGDCHYLVVDPPNHQLIEVYGATTDGTTFTTLTDGRSVAIWDWTKSYLGSLRGDVCTSADASGGLMAPLLFTAEEVAAGHIDHAIRFILPNTRIQNKEYVRPATHGTGSTSGWAQTNGVPYGARFRLHSTFDTSALSAGAKVVAAALMKYGMILSDGGNISFTAKSDAFSTTKWANLLGSHDLSSIKPTDFDMVDASYGTDMESSAKRYDFTSYNCVRNP